MLDIIPVSLKEASCVLKRSVKKPMPNNNMTIKEAIIELNRLKTTERMDIDRERLTAAIDRLVKAARKQIPQKPKHEEFKDGSSTVKCPICDTSEGVCNYNPHFCPKCGQALDWSDV